MKLPKHKSGLYISHNEHKDYYEDIRSAIEAMTDLDAFKDGAAKMRVIETDSLWQLQWYPDTPISFHIVAAPTLEELLEFALEVERKETKHES